MKQCKSTTAVVLGLIITELCSGCSGLFNYLSEERSGNVTIQIINNTPYRASFTIGSYDALDLNPPGSINIEQRRIDANTTAGTFSLSCQRNIAIGTQNMVDRVLATNGQDAAGFDNDAFSSVVNFSSAPAGSAAEVLPTQGTAKGLEVLLGVDFACGDQLIFTFVEDATADGGFRIEYHLLHQDDNN